MNGDCFTVNNYTPENVEKLRCAVGQAGIRYVVFAYERGPINGTPHLQGYFQSTQRKHDRMKAVLGIPHYKPQEATAFEASMYCKGFEKGLPKEGFEAFEQYGTYNPDVKGKNEMKQGDRTDLEPFKVAIESGATMDELRDVGDYEVFIRYNKTFELEVQRAQKRKREETIREEYQGFIARPWQAECLEIVRAPVDNRKIHWYVDEIGDKGKSYLADYLATLGALVLEPGPLRDMAYIMCNAVAPKTVIIDIPKSKTEHIDHIYGFAESLKNGRIQNTKYESRVHMFRRPHVLIFANVYPDAARWSRDRLALHVL